MRIRPRPDAGYMIMIVVVFGILLTAMGAVLLWPTRNALVRAEATRSRLAARQAARSALELALDDLEDGSTGTGQLGPATYDYRVRAEGDGAYAISITARATAGHHVEETILETRVRPAAGGGRPGHETWRLYSRRATD